MYCTTVLSSNPYLNNHHWSKCQLNLIKLVLSYFALHLSLHLSISLTFSFTPSFPTPLHSTSISSLAPFLQPLWLIATSPLSYLTLSHLTISYFISSFIFMTSVPYVRTLQQPGNMMSPMVNHHGSYTQQHVRRTPFYSLLLTTALLNYFTWYINKTVNMTTLPLTIEKKNESSISISMGAPPRIGKSRLTLLFSYNIFALSL